MSVKMPFLPVVASYCSTAIYCHYWQSRSILHHPIIRPVRRDCQLFKLLRESVPSFEAVGILLDSLRYQGLEFRCQQITLVFIQGQEPIFRAAHLVANLPFDSRAMPLCTPLSMIATMSASPRDTVKIAKSSTAPL